MSKSKPYIIRVENELVPVSKQVYRQYHKMRRRERYLQEVDSKRGVLSYHALTADGGTGEDALGDGCGDPVADDAVLNIMVDKLRGCLIHLSEEERLLLRLIFWEEKSESESGKSLGISQQGVSWRLAKTLIKLKKLL